MRILEQGASNLQGGGEGCGEAVGMLMLAMSTLLYRRSGARHLDFVIQTLYIEQFGSFLSNLLVNLPFNRNQFGP